ncbi:uncharacterized protein LOC128955963 [Oppia nitens]|uniref:uncharacterized protein LOC128955963 n=1 Tax=Oppia nitens TaxID=1686743 RepID=UPI0023DC6102|nr:uncharacterized protein LOC128955963 [Oppia nitens]
MDKQFDRSGSYYRKYLESDIFDKSFVLIEKYSKNTGLSSRYRWERSTAKQENRLINWHNVLIGQLSTGGMGYVAAIRKTGELLKQAMKSSNRLDENDFNDVYNSVEQLIQLRNRESKPNLSILGWVIWGGHQYNSHKYR